MNINFVCAKDWILGDVPHQIWEAVTADGTANVLLTRFLHNKLLFYSNNFFRCYFSYLSFDFITAGFSIVGLAFFLYGIYSLISRKKWIFLFFVAIAPLFPLLQIPSDVKYRGMFLYGILGAVILCGLYCATKDLFLRK